MYPQKNLVDIFDEDPTKDYVDEVIGPRTILPSLVHLPDPARHLDAPPAISNFLGRPQSSYADGPSNRRLSRVPMNTSVFPACITAPSCNPPQSVPIVRPYPSLAECYRQQVQHSRSATIEPTETEELPDLVKAFMEGPPVDRSTSQATSIVKTEQSVNREEVFENKLDVSIPTSPFLTAQKSEDASFMFGQMTLDEPTTQEEEHKFDITSHAVNKNIVYSFSINDDLKFNNYLHDKHLATDTDIDSNSTPVKEKITPKKMSERPKYGLNEEQKKLLGMATVKAKPEWRRASPPEVKPTPMKYADNKYQGPPSDAFKPVANDSPSTALSDIKIETTYTAGNPVKRESELMDESFHLKKRQKTVICTCTNCPLVNDNSYLQCECAAAGEPCDRWCHEPEVRAKEEKFTTIKCARNPGTTHRVKKWEAGGRF